MNEPSESKELIPFSENPEHEQKDLATIEAKPDLVIQMSPEVEEKLKEMGISVEGSEMWVTLEAKKSASMPTKKLIFPNYRFQDASAVKTFEKNGEIFIRVTVKANPHTKKPEHKVFHKITYSRGYGAAATGGIEENEKDSLQGEFGLTGEE